MASANPIQVEKYLKGIDFPASKQDLVQCAKENDAPEEVLSMLEQLSGKQYNSPVDITKEFKQQ